MATVVNNTNASLMLEDGTIIGAAHTTTAKRENVTLGDGDRKRLVEPGHLSVIKETPAPAAYQNAAPQRAVVNNAQEKTSDKQAKQ
jgi:hypothetical protein